MLSKNQLKFIVSLQQKKYRNKHGLFIAEGVKVVNEFLNSQYRCSMLFCTDEFTPEHNRDKITHISHKELEKISVLKSPNKVLGVFEIPQPIAFKDEGLIVALDGVNDPGNLGTIIRLCDWFGVSQLLCSENSVDCYNSKVVQASMGSLTRVAVRYENLVDLLQRSKLPKYGAFMNGEPVYSKEIETAAILVLGNEANGISSEIESLLDTRISIPRYGSLQETESLNVATATAILLNEFRRALFIRK